jgi:hypothetical protein
MATLRYWSAFEVDLNGSHYSDGSRSAPVEKTVTQRAGGDISLATATSLTLWDSSQAVTDFDFFWMICDKELKVELTVDRGGEVGLEELAFVHPANTPFVLADDAALANYSSDISLGTADVIDKIRIRNESGDTATGTWWLFT